jgi:hypothetical protein
MTARPKDPEQDFVDAIYSGDERASTSALKTLLAYKRGVGPQAVEQLVQRELQRAAVERELARFRNDFADVADDPYLGTVADQILAETTGGRRLEDLPVAAVADALNAAGTRTRDWARSVRQSSREDKPQDEPPSVSRVIAEMRRGRGQ